MLQPSPRRMLLTATLGGFLLGAGPFSWLAAGARQARQAGPGEVEAVKPAGFAFEKSLTLPASPEQVFDAMTGDISAWWDHSFSKEPHALYIEPKPGGGFYEIFDEEGNGALHATVVYAKRGEALRFIGPLGLSSLGIPLEMVHSFTFEAEGEGTRLTLRVRATGEIPAGIGVTVSGVWDHFLVERLLPHVEAGAGGGR